MRPICLTMEAFGPYLDKTVIPFHRFGRNGLVLITGNTGSGKTTIFDAITFALYGETSSDKRDGKRRDNRTPEMLRSDYADPKVKTYVTLEFEHDSGMYTIIREPAYEREGYKTKTTAGVSLVLPDSTILKNSRDIDGENGKIREIMGINVEQFRQVAMIAQGEFQKLLYASTDERVNLFRSIFDTNRFFTIQTALNEANKENTRIYNELKEKISEKIRDICVPLQGDYEQLSQMKQNADVHVVEELMQLLEKLNEDDNRQMIDITKAINDNNTLINRLSGEIQTAKNINNKVHTWEECLKKAAEYAGRLPQMEQLREKIKLHEKAMQIRPYVVQYESRNAELQNNQGKRQMYEKKLKQAAPLLTELLDVYERQSKINQEPYIQQITELENKEKQYERLKQFREQQEESEIVYKKSETALKGAEDELKKTNEDITSCEEQIRQLSEVPVKLGNCIAAMERIRERYLALMEIADVDIDGREGIAAQTAVLEQKKKELICLVDKRNEKNQRYMKLDTEYSSHFAGQLAKDLKEGEPCKVCGSLHHPNLATLPENAPHEEDVNRAKDALDQVEKEYTKKKEEALALDQSISTNRQNVIKKVNAFLGEKLEEKDFTVVHQLLTREMENVKSQETERKAEKKAFEEQVARKEKMEMQLTKLKALIISRTRLVDEARSREKADIADFVSKRKQYDDLNVLLTEPRESITQAKKQLVCQLQEIRESLQKTRKEYEKAKSENDTDRGVLDAVNASIAAGLLQVKESKKELDGMLVKYDFSDRDEYQKALMDEAAYIRSKTEERIFAQEKSINDTRMEDLKKEEIPTKQRIDILLLEQKKQECSRENEARETIKGRLGKRHTINGEIYKKLNQYAKDFNEADTRLAQSRKLNNVANGNYKFETYIQGVFFDRIIQQANVRLSHMMNNQFELKRGARSSGNRGLDLLIHDYRTGKDRDVRSISGGESFVTSLSMALGLSDIVQYNNAGVKLDTMFIDEGFGSLDSDTLEQSIRTLQEMSKGDCLVGIISHVSELRERIDKKIVVTKTNNGSKVDIVC
jgi:exonuclease SbcC